MKGSSVRPHALTLLDQLLEFCMIVCLFGFVLLSFITTTGRPGSPACWAMGFYFVGLACGVRVTPRLGLIARWFWFVLGGLAGLLALDNVGRCLA